MSLSGEDLTCSPKPDDDVLAVKKLLRLLVGFVVLVIFGAGDLLIVVTILTRLLTRDHIFPQDFFRTFSQDLLKVGDWYLR